MVELNMDGPYCFEVRLQFSKGAVEQGKKYFREVFAEEAAKALKEVEELFSKHFEK